MRLEGTTIRERVLQHEHATIATSTNHKQRTEPSGGSESRGSNSHSKGNNGYGNDGDEQVVARWLENHLRHECAAISRNKTNNKQKTKRTKV